ncbi:TM0106 family RecB-like putative nuclease [Croceicoccus bisphenolivorans]|uniref:TM0106 family RecB-like putative nuclease n=1 Tax=Croceicoccus bisphenolivorans TaxID=1783232 RepID=UPI00083703FD|nr:TM0106 family RecB-like putative nuclease [Croceicoccus bisphenolivorans]
MQIQNGTPRLSATDLVGYLNCRHLTQLEHSAARGELSRPKFFDPALEALWERGKQHELAYVEHLRALGLSSVVIDGVDVTEEAVAQTIAAMRAGVDVIVQGALRGGSWAGRADILQRVDTPSDLGDWSYEAADTKLARETKGGTVLQLCLYSELIGEVQGTMPVFASVIPPWTDFAPERYRLADFAAYHRQVKQGLLGAIGTDKPGQTYPEPTSNCDICNWSTRCDKQRRDDDHLCLVAGISSMQIAELKDHGVTTATALAELPLPLQWKPERGSKESLTRVREQARIQLETKASGELRYELLAPVAGFGLNCLPEPCDGDIFLDFEGDSFVGQHGLEYLLGFHFREKGEPQYRGLWALDRAGEKAAFETFIDFVLERMKLFPQLHVYHYGGYEPGALKRLMGRYGTREDELDSLLRGLVFVDLLSVVRHSLRAGVESYSIKKLEPLYGYVRDASLPDANLALNRLQVSLELNDAAGILPEDKQTVEAYNRDDCVSTEALRDWLEAERAKLIARGIEVTRPEPGESGPSEGLSEWLERITPLIEQLTADVPVDPEERTAEQHARWLLANLLEWHRREEKATWWEYFRLSDLSADELIDERAGLAGLAFLETVGGTAKCPIDRYSFPVQEADIRAGKGLRAQGGQTLGTVEDISREQRTIDIKKASAMAGEHPVAVFVHEHVPSKPMQESLVRLATHVCEHGMAQGEAYQAARDMLMRVAPRIADGSAVRLDGEKPLDAGVRIGPLISAGVLPIQGPPGTGKTHTGGHMICELVRQGNKVGIVANGHEVIRNLLNKVIEVAEETDTPLICIQKPKGGSKEDATDRLRFAKKSNAEVFAALSADCSVAGGTAWLWSTEDAFESLDVLFVDEAAQMSLANVLAVSQAAKTLVLLGDPQQLDQPMQGSHPDGTGCSALDHLLSGKQTIAPDEGLFLDVTWRLHPDICAFTSELFYEGKLGAKAEAAGQRVNAKGIAHGTGLRFLPVEHSGNQNCSSEEADVIAELVSDILAQGATWIDREGNEKPLGIADILIIAPYNAQVFEIQRRLPQARVGTVDKFQGQEAPISIYSLASSSHADAPRGMEFLYSLNRLNVATSRAKCVTILVGSPQVFEAECRTPRQMQLANAFCRYLELSS